MRCVATGPCPAAIALVGEAPGAKEEELGMPFVGPSGHILDGMLKDAKLSRNDLFVTNLLMDRPPSNKIELWIHPKVGQPILLDDKGKPLKDEKGKRIKDPNYVRFRGKWVRSFVVEEHARLVQELTRCKPNVVIAAGGYALWALTPFTGVKKWRGSVLESDVIPGLKVIPLYHPAAILRQYELKYITTQDLRRVKHESSSAAIVRPAYNFILNPSLQTIFNVLNTLHNQADAGDTVRLVCDLEIKRNEILCAGIAWSKRDAICIPFYDAVDPERVELGGKFRFDPETHVVIVDTLRKLLCHPNVRLCNQNISFDIQFLFWRFNIWPKAAFDTMIAQNILFAGEPKSLDYLASMYCEHYIYWKDDGKFWEKPVNYPQLWEYNCKDCVITFEVWEAQERALKGLKLEPQMAFFMDLFHPVMQMMLRGVAVDVERKRQLTKELRDFIEAMKQEAEYIAGCSLLGDKGGFSPDKLKRLLYDEMLLPKQFNRQQGKMILTCDDEALKRLGKREPLVKPLLLRINLARSYKTALDAVNKKVDADSRWRTAYNLAGTNTYRFSSSENPLDSGLNLQNLTSGKDILKEL